MIFNDFLALLPVMQGIKLPATTAHNIMAPAQRIQALEYANTENARQSAVLMLFYPKNNQTHFVLTKRNTYAGIHSAQISFPGGKAEPEDTGFADTALREAWEEIGVLPTDVEMIMPFTELYIPPSNFMVHPFLGITHRPDFLPNEREVAQIIEVPLDVLLDDNTMSTISMKTSYANEIDLPAFKIDGEIVWGATAMILSELKETIKSVI